MPDPDDEDFRWVVANGVNNAIVAGAKAEKLALPLQTPDTQRAGGSSEAVDLVANPLPLGAGEIGQLPQCCG
jgi:hypothetical protein